MAKTLGITQGQLRRIAKTKPLPGQRQTSGGQLRWQDCAGLRNYITNRLLKKNASSARTRIRRNGRPLKPPVPNPFSSLDDADHWAMTHADVVLTPEQATF